MTRAQAKLDHTQKIRETNSPCDHRHNLINVDISGISRRSLKGILIIFEDDFEHGQRNADRFVSPRIKKIELTIDGNSNALYNKGYKEENQWCEICRHFMPEDSKQSDNTYINLKSSHARTVVRECCKRDDESHWEMGIFDPQPPNNPLTDGHQNLCT